MAHRLSTIKNADEIMEELWVTPESRTLIGHARATYSDALTALGDGLVSLAHDLQKGADTMIDRAVMLQT